MTEWTKKNQQAAHLQGWELTHDIMDLRIARVKGFPGDEYRFASYAAAQAFVAWKALQGDKLAYTAVNYLAEKHSVKDQTQPQKGV